MRITGNRAQVGENLGAIQLDQLGALGPAVVRNQLEFEALGGPDEHHHDAGVGGGHEGILGGEHAWVTLGIRWGGKIHLRAIAHDDVPPVFAFPGDGGVVSGGAAHADDLLLLAKSLVFAQQSRGVGFFSASRDGVVNSDHFQQFLLQCQSMGVLPSARNFGKDERQSHKRDFWPSTWIS